MTVREMRMQLGITQADFGRRYNIPLRTLQHWEGGERVPPEYVSELLENRVFDDMVNRKAIEVPKFDPRKKNLPPKCDFMTNIAWLKAVRECLCEEVTFALDDALMCMNYFVGFFDERVVWVYGSDALSRFNGVVILGNEIDRTQTIERDGLTYTNFNRTINDAIANEPILDMQGTTEGLSNYFFDNNESFDGLYIQPKHRIMFEKLAADAIEYFNS